MSNFIDKYKKKLAFILGNICLVIGLYAPALSLLLLTNEKIHWTTSNTVFTGLGIIFLWGEIVSFAKVIQDVLGNKK